MCVCVFVSVRVCRGVHVLCMCVHTLHISLYVIAPGMLTLDKQPDGRSAAALTAELVRVPSGVARLGAVLANIVSCLLGFDGVANLLRSVGINVYHEGIVVWSMLLLATFKVTLRAWF